MSRTLTVTPQKVHLLNADQAGAGVQDILEKASVEIDPRTRSVTITGNGRTEEGSIEGDVIASDQAEDRRDDDALQHPLVHEGAEPDSTDPNEDADDKATILQPSGDPVEDAREG